MHRAGIVADRARRAARQADNVEIGCRATEIEAIGDALVNRGDGVTLRRAADQHRLDAARLKLRRQLREHRFRPTFFRPLRRGARHQQHIRRAQMEAVGIRLHPAQVGWRHLGDTGQCELFFLALDRMEKIAARIAMSVGGAARDARPFRRFAEGRRHQAVIETGPVGCLQVIDTVELSTLEPARQSDPAANIQGPGAVIGPDRVEITASLRQFDECGNRQQGDLGLGMVTADRGEGPHGKREIPQRAELDDQDSAAARGRHGRRAHTRPGRN